MPKKGKMRLSGRMYLICEAPVAKCSTANRTCVCCKGSNVLVVQMDAKGRVTIGPGATDPLKFGACQNNFKAQEAYSLGTEWGQRHIDGKVYRRNKTKKKGKS